MKEILERIRISIRVCSENEHPDIVTTIIISLSELEKGWSIVFQASLDTRYDRITDVRIK